MKLRIFILLCSAVVLVSCNKDEISEKQANTFIKFLAHEDMMITGSDIRQTSDGGYIILGTGTYEDETSDIYLAKTDEFGQEENWSPVTIGGADYNEEGNRLEILDDGYLILGNSDDDNDDNFDMYLVKTDFQGNITWEQTYGDDLNNQANDVQVLDDGGFILAGYYTREISEEEFTIDPYFLKTDAGGVKVGVDYKLGEDEYNEIPYAIHATASGYLVIGEKVDVTTDESDLWIRLLPENLGSILPVLDVPDVDERDDYGVDLVETDDDRIFFLANREEQASGRLESFVGELEWNIAKKTYEVITAEFSLINEPDANVVVNDMIYSPENYLVITGRRQKAGNNDLMLQIVDMNANPVQQHFFGGSGSQTGNAICYTSDDRGYIIVGTNSFEDVMSMISLVKTGPDGELNQ